MEKITLFFVFLAHISFSQLPNSLNQKNDKGEKCGFWVVYLTDRLIPIKDSTNAFYFAYKFFDGDYIDNIDLIWERKKASKLVIDGATGIKGKPILLNGDFKFYDKKGRLSWEETYKDGRPLMLQTFTFDKKGECSLHEIIDYSKRYNSQIGSYYFEQYGYSNKLLEGKYYRRQNSKWDFERNK